MPDKTPRYSPRRLRLFREIYGAADGHIGYQTTDGVPSDLIIGHAVVSAATNRDFAALRGGRLVSAKDGQVRVTGWGMDLMDDWMKKFGERDADKLREVVL